MTATTLVLWTVVGAFVVGSFSGAAIMAALAVAGLSDDRAGRPRG